jgi:IS1 family transposase
MNNLKQKKQEMVLSLLVEGNSIRSIERITDIHRDTIMRLMIRAGDKARSILDKEMRGLNPKNIQVDEIWCFVGKKQKHLTLREKKTRQLGDQYVYVALDAETKLVPAFYIGKRTIKDCFGFISDLADRIDSRYQLSTDSYKAYMDVI